MTDDVVRRPGRPRKTAAPVVEEQDDTPGTDDSPDDPTPESQESDRGGLDWLVGFGDRPVQWGS